MRSLEVTLVDYGAGNLPSVERAFARLGVHTRRAETGAELSDCEAIVLPGVGHFGAMMRALDERGLANPLRHAIESHVPLLGICLGLQALYEESEEAPGLAGLGVFRGGVGKLPSHVKLPHMGWNQVRRIRPGVLLRGLAEQSWFYFAHSYAVAAPREESVAGCEHGREIVAALEQGSVMAVQFHPEKSGAAGARVLRNFAEIAAGAAQ